MIRNIGNGESDSEEVNDFSQIVGMFIPNFHEKVQICRFEHIKAAF